MAVRPDRTYKLVLEDDAAEHVGDARHVAQRSDDVKRARTGQSAGLSAV